VTVAATAAGPTIPRGFLGFSFEFPALPAYAGTNPRAPDLVLAQLTRLTHTGGRWSAAVRPMYYSMLAFADAAPPGARLVPVSVRTSANLTAWATRDRRDRLRVVLINKCLTRGSVENLAVSARHAPTAAVARLLAPAPAARGGVSLAGQAFGPRTFTGRLSGNRQNAVLRAPDRSLLVRVPAASAATVVVQLLGGHGRHP
jgi:hypothetical protein